ncbi:hypothetical protein [Rhodanobacter sp. C03]|uniref:hypothetical protein n=1 Tax=Rhodanobacter sp. C03 TaxID=1945858 RepID=UPI000984F9D5|nr:hypothetical protein [Rhodanobacter sp. C03]OOG59778.1 hypothetical protein B0E48_03010 [Rhodanobacter sp. C03]
MKLRFWLVGAFVGAALLQTSGVYAKAEVIVKAENKGDFATVVMAVHQEMQPGGRYEFIDQKNRQKIDTIFTEMQSLFDKSDTIAQMNQSDKVQLFNDQEAANAILTRSDDKRMVCETVAPLGSHIPKTVCRTYREVEQEHRDTQNLQQQMQQVNNPSGSSFPGPKGGH